MLGKGKLDLVGKLDTWHGLDAIKTPCRTDEPGLELVQVGLSRHVLGQMLMDGVFQGAFQ